MIESQHAVLLVLLFGGIIVLAILIRSAFQRIAVPSLIGFLILGFLLGLVDSHWRFIPDEASSIFEFLANIGIILLLFRVGLESNLAGLVRQLRRASLIWLGNVVFSGILGYAVSYFFLGLAFIPSLFIGIALTATSVGISVGVWQEAKAIRSRNGELLVDVAEMDDISAIVFMALLFAVAPVLTGGVVSALLPFAGRTLGLVLLKLIAFGASCVLFARYAEQPITHFFKKIEPKLGPILMVAGFGFIIAALGGFLGLSIAMGAFFAGLMFSRDPEAVKFDRAFGLVYEIFIPFFFIGIGLNIDPNQLTTALGLGAILLVVAVLGKAIGTGGPAMLMMDWKSSTLLGVSMIPRAEIAMVIMLGGLQLGGWAVPPNVFAAMIFVCAGTSIISPIILRLLLKRWPQTSGPKM